MLFRSPVPEDSHESVPLGHKRQKCSAYSAALRKTIFPVMRMNQKRNQNDKRISAAKEAKSPVSAPVRPDPEEQDDGVILTTAEAIDFAQGADSR